MPEGREEGGEGGGPTSPEHSEEYDVIVVGGVVVSIFKKSVTCFK